MTKKKDKKLILVTNDDGINSKGLKSLIGAMMPLGEIVVVAPSDPQSATSQCITVKYPLRIDHHHCTDHEKYSVNGTPTDCVKLALNRILKRKPDLLVSGINHGSNSSTSVLYSGTVGAALEGTVNRIPSIGFSLANFDPDANFSASIPIVRKVSEKVLDQGIPERVCLNVNIPPVSGSEIKGIKACRQAMGCWQEEFDKRKDPSGRDYYWLTGYYKNLEPDNSDTDEYALQNNFVTIVPINIDFTCYSTLKSIENWEI